MTTPNDHTNTQDVYPINGIRYNDETNTYKLGHIDATTLNNKPNDAITSIMIAMGPENRRTYQVSDLDGRVEFTNIKGVRVISNDPNVPSFNVNIETCYSLVPVTCPHCWEMPTSTFFRDEDAILNAGGTIERGKQIRRYRALTLATRAESEADARVTVKAVNLDGTVLTFAIPCIKHESCVAITGDITSVHQDAAGHVTKLNVTKVTSPVVKGTIFEIELGDYTYVVGEHVARVINAYGWDEVFLYLRIAEELKTYHSKGSGLPILEWYDHNARETRYRSVAELQDKILDLRKRLDETKVGHAVRYAAWDDGRIHDKIVLANEMMYPSNNDNHDGG